MFLLPLAGAGSATGVVQIGPLSFAYRYRPARRSGRIRANIPESKEVRVWDSSAELRYLVLPERPAGTDGWSEAQLIELVTRDSMIGTGLVAAP
nr:nitrile hydratase subunit alpha [Klebsiella variicola]